MDIHNLTAKDRKKLHTWLRALIQLLYFLFIPSIYTAAFAGVKYIFTQIGAGEKIAMTSFVTVLLVICLYTMVFGRFFCGFACAFGAFGLLQLVRIDRINPYVLLLYDPCIL